MTSKDIREKYIKFFVSRGHKEIVPARLVPENDPTTLFTSSGMQPLVPYLLGEEHPAGRRLVNSQPCFRAEDIEEVGDNRHTTFFEMLGNWSLGDYFKKEQLPWIWEFLTKELGLPKEKLYVSVFEGNDSVPKDTESYKIWKSLGIADDHIFFYGVDKNWWSRVGSPDKMPAGEIGGPDSEIFYEFSQVEHDKKYGEKCHLNCNCGHFLEIGNSVFIEYQKQEDGPPAGGLKELSQKNVDFGGGLERLIAVVEDNPDIFQTDLYRPIIDAVEKLTGEKYSDLDNQEHMRIIADHLKAATFLILNGVVPSNKLHGYVLRRLLRRSLLKMIQLAGEKKGWMMWMDLEYDNFEEIFRSILSIYDGLFSIQKGKNENMVIKMVSEEFSKFGNTLLVGLRKIEIAVQKKQTIDGLFAFDLYQTCGFPLELTLEELSKLGIELTDYDRKQFRSTFEDLKIRHSELSRTASAGMFKGGLADQSEIVTKYHTATHLLHQALRDILGPQVVQKGSNITVERLRFDFSFDREMTDEEIKQVEDLVNEKIKEDLIVTKEVMDKDKALQSGALGFFTEKYGDKVTVYSIGNFSREICGGPHVKSTGVIGKINRGTIPLRGRNRGTILQGKIKITKEEAVSSGIRRIRAEIVIR